MYYGIDYEDLILARQERIEMEDFNCEDIPEEKIEVICNPILIREMYKEKDRLMREDPEHWERSFEAFEAWHKDHPEFVF